MYKMKLNNIKASLVHFQTPKCYELVLKHLSCLTDAQSSNETISTLNMCTQNQSSPWAKVQSNT